MSIRCQILKRKSKIQTLKQCLWYNMQIKRINSDGNKRHQNVFFFASTSKQYTKHDLINYIDEC